MRDLDCAKHLKVFIDQCLDCSLGPQFFFLWRKDRSNGMCAENNGTARAPSGERESRKSREQRAESKDTVITFLSISSLLGTSSR